MGTPYRPSPDKQEEINRAIRQDEIRKAAAIGKALWDQTGVGVRHNENGSLDLMAHDGFKSSFEKVLRLSDDGGIIVLMGDRGTGKTQCAVEALRLWCYARHRGGRYVRAREIGMIIRNTYATHESEMTAFNRLAYAGLLVIDEFQERGGTEWDDKQITTLIDARYANRKPTIIICNMTPQAFKESAGASIVDRIHECGGVINFNWKSFRRA